MCGHVQYIKWSKAKGEFLVRVDSQMVDVVEEVRNRLSDEYRGEVDRVLSLVNFRSHPDYSVLVVTPRADAHDNLEMRVRASVQLHERAVLAKRQGVSRAS